MKIFCDMPNAHTLRGDSRVFKNYWSSLCLIIPPMQSRKIHSRITIVLQNANWLSLAFWNKCFWNNSHSSFFRIVPLSHSPGRYVLRITFSFPPEVISIGTTYPVLAYIYFMGFQELKVVTGSHEMGES